MIGRRWMIWLGSLIGRSIPIVGPPKSGEIRKRRPAGGMTETRKKWRMDGGGIGVGVLLLVLLEIWAIKLMMRTPYGILVVELNGAIILAGWERLGNSIERFPSPEECYRVTFGMGPGHSVSGLQGEGRAFRDSGHCYLRFRITEPDLTSLLGGQFRTIAREEFIAETAGAALFGPAPAWWTPLSGKPTTFMRSEGFHPSFSRGRAFLSYDAGTQIVHLYWDGLD